MSERSPAGKRNPALRHLRELRRDRRLRDAERALVAEGLHLVGEALAAGAPMRSVAWSARLLGTPGGLELLDGLRDRDIPLLEADDEALVAVQDARSAQPIVAIVQRPEIPPQPREGTPLWVIADGVQDPGNLGAMIRSADAAGATMFYATGNGADLYHPRTVRATMGSIFRLPVRFGDAARVARSLSEDGILRLGTVRRGGIDYDRFDLGQPLALFFGSEGAGLSEPLRQGLDAQLCIPMSPGVESLSVSAASAALLFEAARQRRVADQDS